MTSPAPLPLPRPTSDKQAAANRQNCELSTGPMTLEGKQIVAMNALVHGLAAESPLLPDEDANLYASFSAALTARFHADEPHEAIIVQRIVALAWRLRRVPAVETEVLRRLSAADDDESDPATPSRAAVAYMKDAGHLPKLHDIARHEVRLHKLFWREVAELQALKRLNETIRGNIESYGPYPAPKQCWPLPQTPDLA